jgi:hypothetical protein
MKIRSGFVSNSSSSSFILKLPFYPESVDDMRRMLLGDENPLLLTHYGDEGFPTNQIMEIIYNDVINAIGRDKKRPIDSIDRQEIDISQHNIDDFDNKISSKYRTEYNKLKKEFLSAYKRWDHSYMDMSLNNLPPEEKWKITDGYLDQMDHIGDKIKDMVIDSIKEKSLDTDIHISLEYSDNDGSIGAFIEHGGILDPITVTTISHH